MSRFAPIINLEDLQLKCHSMVEKSFQLTSTIEKDLSKINFDWENYEYETGSGFSSYPCGYEVLSNKLPVLFVNAGGDWEFPICFIIYWDGNKLRGYIPEEGNVFNKKQRCAYGSEDDGEVDLEDITEEPNVDLIRQDIIKRIQIK